MKNYSYIVLILLTLLFSCDKDDNNEHIINSGVYKGTFQRKSVTYERKIANVTLTFTGDKWEGTSNIEKYPALCRGTYSIDGDVITFENECAWTAEFDWSLILSGKYLIEESGNNLDFYRVFNPETTESYTDIYILVKQD